MRIKRVQCRNPNKGLKIQKFFSQKYNTKNIITKLSQQQSDVLIKQHPKLVKLLFAMKIFSPKIIRKSPNQRINPFIKKILNSPKGPKLRSRKIIYPQEQILQQSDEEIQEKVFTTPNIVQNKNFQKVAQSQQDMHINENKNLDLQNLLRPKKQGSSDQFEQDPFEDFGGESIQQEKEKLKASPQRKKRESKLVRLKQVLSCDKYKKIKEIDLMIYFKILAKTKMFSTLIVNELGQVIFADRLGSEHFEGSLNNFGRNPIYSMILECQLPKFLEKVERIRDIESTILKLVIYSKNSKRRYSKSSNELSLTNQDLFNRYLKCISCQIIPIEITISSTEQFQGYWNQNLFEFKKPLKCFLFRSRLSKTMPQLEGHDLQQDKKIQKFLKYTRKKQAERGVMVKFQGDNEEENFFKRKQKEFGVQKYIDNCFLNKNDIENIYNQMNEDDLKHSKSNLTRGFFINSGDGKHKDNFD